LDLFLHNKDFEEVFQVIILLVDAIQSLYSL